MSKTKTVNVVGNATHGCEFQDDNNLLLKAFSILARRRIKCFFEGFAETTKGHKSGGFGDTNQRLV
jgi:hypothetical protein